jgi:hypothetical protein
MAIVENPLIGKTRGGLDKPVNLTISLVDNFNRNTPNSLHMYITYHIFV